MNEAVIITDSIFKDCEPPRGSLLIAKGGATIKQISKDIKYERITVKEHKLCVLHVGTNDIGNGDYGVLIPRYSELLYQIRRHNPTIDIVICAILPRPADYNYTKFATDYANFLLEDWCTKKDHLHFNRTYKGYLTFNRPILELYATDGIHLGRLGAIKGS